MFFVLMARGSQYLPRIHAQGPTCTDCWGVRILNPYFGILTSKNKYNVYSKNAYLRRSFLRIKGNAKILCLYRIRLGGDGKLRRLFF